MIALFECWHEMAPAWGEAIGRGFWQGGLAIAAVWGICRYWPTMPARWRCWLWRLAFAKILLCLFWNTPVKLPLLPAAGTAQPIVIASEPHAPAPNKPYGLPALPVLPALTIAKPENSAWGIPEIALLIWGSGVLLGFLGLLRHWRRTRRVVQSSSNAISPFIAATNDELVQFFGLRQPPRIRVTEELSTPLVTGLLQPVILLPQNALEEGDSRKFRMMLAHELAHLKRGDLWWNWLAILARWLFFFHPLVWLAKRESELANEMGADALALTVSGVRTADYAELLVEVTAGRLNAQCPHGAIGIFGSRGSIKRRINAMKTISKISARQTIAAAFCICAAGLILILPWRVVASEPGSNPPKVSNTDIPATTHRVELEDKEVAAEPTSKPTVTVDVNGRYSYNRHPMELSVLPSALKREATPGEPIQVLVLAHPKAQVRAVVALLDALQAAGISNVSLATNREPLPKIFNLDFGPSRPQPSEQSGPAAAGEPGDYWNSVGVAWNSDHVEWDLKFASGEISPIQVRMINLGGCWGNSGGMGVQAPMLDSFNYPVGNQGGNSQVLLSDVPAGKYDVYLYGHGIDNLYYGDYTLTVGQRPYGRKTTSQRHDAVNNTRWVEGSQYVRFKNVQVGSGDRMDILIRPGGEVTDHWGRKVSDAMICGLQLVPVGRAPN